ncbi:hypothetical protein BKP42_24190 [Rhodococcus erythropolis]|nr:hypothetical protein BKP42_24190 [Rhodococcus erythropolis]
MHTAVKLPNSELARLANKPPWYRSLFVQLIAAIVIGVSSAGCGRNLARTANPLGRIGVKALIYFEVVTTKPAGRIPHRQVPAQHHSGLDSFGLR